MNAKAMLLACAVSITTVFATGHLLDAISVETGEVFLPEVGACMIDPPAEFDTEVEDDWFDTEDVYDTDEPEDDPITPSESDARLIAQILYYEIGAGTKLAQSAVVWTILNRVDSEIPYFPDTIEEVCKQSIKSNGKEVFMFAYNPEAPVREDLYDMAMDVMTRWYREKRGEENVGRTLPVEYVYFWGNGKTNFFRIEYQGKDYWDWSLPNPYDDEP